MEKVSRLINFFKPNNYELTLKIEREKREFSGEVKISGEILQDFARLHSKDLEIISAKVNGAQAEVLHGENDEITLKTADKISGECEISLEFSGKITDQLHGLYPCYFDVNGEKKELLMTQFESHHAREMFPCVDEPEAKATFDFTVLTEKNISVLGNMPIKSQEEDGEFLVTKFDKTPKMSTYLLALVAGELQKKTTKTSGGIEVSVWATHAQKPESLDFALDHAARTIELYNDFFGVDYPLPKSDHVAVPDFSAGAMENWGLITYRESALLAVPNESLANKQHIATVISHELNHQWFGNLVTMKWWNNLWLNESFSNMMEYLAVDKLHPDWQMLDDFCLDEGAFAFNRDSINGVQSVQTDVNHPDEIGTLFDGAIVYAKGGRLLYMMLNWIGEDAFRKGLNDYFTKHAYKNTEGDDLWQALSAASGKDVGGLMNKWILNPGFPLVNIEKSDGKIRLKQERFFVGERGEDSTIWPIPLKSNHKDLPEIFDEKEIEIDDNGEILQLNIGDTSHFITKYDDETLQKLLDEVRAGKMSVVDRAQLIYQQILLAKAEIVESASLLDFLDAYQNETSEKVWSMISTAIAHLKLIIESDEAKDALKKIVEKMAEKNFEKLGWHKNDGESENDAKLRPIILSKMLYAKNETAISEGQKIFADNKNSLENIDDEIRFLVLETEVKFGENPEKTVKDLFDLYTKTADVNLRHNFSDAICTAKNDDAIDFLIENLSDQSKIRPQDLVHWYVRLLRNKNSREQTWNWMKSHWDLIKKLFDGDKSLDRFPRYAGNILTKTELLEDFKAFFLPMRDDPALTRTIDMAITDISARIDFMEKNRESVESRAIEIAQNL